MPAEDAFPEGRAERSRLLAEAIEAGEVSTVRELVEADPEILHDPRWHPPALHCAILWEQPAVAGLLLDLGANLEQPDPDRGVTPLRYAVMFGKAEMVELLLERGANPGPRGPDDGSVLALARRAAAGEFEEYDDLPPREIYREVVEVLERAGLES